MYYIFNKVAFPHQLVPKRLQKHAFLHANKKALTIFIL